MNPMTVGEAVERFGYAQIMLRIAKLAEACKRIPVGEWDYRFQSDSRYRVILNGGKTDEWSPEPGLSVPRFHAMVVHDGWPKALVNAAGGWVAMTTEEAVLNAIDVEIARVEVPA